MRTENANYMPPLEEINSIIEKMLFQLRNTNWLPRNNSNRDCYYAACFPALVTALKIDAPLQSLCTTLPPKTTGINLVSLLNSLATLGYIAFPVRISLSSLDKRLMPCLFVPDSKGDCKPAPIVIISGEEKQICVFDSKKEQVCYLPINEQEAKGTVYFFIREDEAETSLITSTREASGSSWFYSILQRFSNTFWQIFAISFIIRIVALAPPLFIMLVYDHVIGSHSPETLNPLLVGVLLALLTEWKLRTVRTKSLAWFGARTDNIVVNSIFSHLLELPLSYTERASISSQLARLKSFATVRSFFTSNLFITLIELPFVVITLIAIAYISGIVVLVPIVTALIYILIAVWIYPRLRTATRIAATANTNRKQMTIETVKNMHALRVSGLTSSWYSQFRDLSGKGSHASFRSQFLGAILETVTHALFLLAGMATIIVGVHQIWANTMTSGALIACIVLVWRVIAPFRTICMALPKYLELQTAISQINRLMDIKTERSHEKEMIKVAELKGKIHFERVGLRYGRESTPVFTGLSCTINPGELIVITGGNGTGKSTALKLINGQYRPQIGSILLDDMDIRQLDPIGLRQKASYAPQNPQFFHGTIADNLRFSEPLATDEMLRVVLMQSCAWEEVCNLPDGLYTIIGGRDSTRIPSLLAYKINLARAYLKNTCLMLFDEQPYALLNDKAGESFHELLASWKGYRTVVIVSHREDYIRLADQVILLRGNESPVVGNPDEIIRIISKNTKNREKEKEDIFNF